MRRRTFFVACSIAAAGCGSEPDPTQSDPEIAVVTTAPAAATPSAMTSVKLGGSVGAIGTTADGAIAVAAGERIYELEAGAPDLRALYADPGDPDTLGAVHAIAPKKDGGAWIAAEAGLFELDPLYVTSTRLVIGKVFAASEISSGALGGLWVTTDDGLIRRQGAKLDRYDIPNLEGTPSDVAVDAAGTCALVVADSELALLEATGTKVLSDRPPLEAGEIRAVAAGRGVLFAASAGGVLRFDPKMTPKWTRFTLGGADVLAIAVDPVTSVAWARTPEALIEIDGDTLESYAMASAPADPVIAVDRLGDVWSANADGLDRLSTGAMGAAVTYANDVKPWVGMYCSSCHKNQTQNFEDFAVFSEKAEEAIGRVRSGDMPRCLGGVPCPAEQRLGAAEYAVLEQWIRAGKPE